MKTIRIKNGVVTLLCAAVLAGLTACEADPVEMNGGKLPDKDGLENTYVTLRSMSSVRSENAIVNLSEGGINNFKDKLYCRISHPAEQAMTVKAEIDGDLVAVYNAVNGTDYAPFPEANVTFSKECVISIDAGKQISHPVDVTFSPGDLPGGDYLLPVTISAEGVKFSEANRTVYYHVVIYKPYEDDYPLDTEMGLSVIYLNTSDYQPLLVDAIGMTKSGRREEWTHSYGNIVNLRTVQIGLDEASGRAMLMLNSDIRWVLEHADKYIRPLQDKGRKVCLSLEGNGSGLGFCNLTDPQIADFVSQVKALVESYPIDGINLWDRNSGYGAVGLPEMNTTSYPKLIVALREALGADKLLTLTDYKEPTEYFWNTEATGGIEVGKYIDYAWSGYMSNDEGIQVVDPWKQGQDGVSVKYPRKPIAGLTADKYGCVGFPFRAVGEDDFEKAMEEMMNLQMWAGMGRSNDIIVFNDMITAVQGTYEGVIWDTFSTFAWQNWIPYDGYQYLHAILHPDKMDHKYNGYAKDW